MNTAQPRRAAPEEQTARTPSGRPVTTDTRARQGVTGHGVRYVLGWGLAAVVIAFAIAYIVAAAGH